MDSNSGQLNLRLMSVESVLKGGAHSLEKIAAALVHQNQLLEKLIEQGKKAQ